MSRRIFIIIAFTISFVIPNCVQAQNNILIQKRINALLTDTALQHAFVAFTARNLTDSSDIINFNGNKSLVPASIQKVITTGVALETLDTTFQFKTRIGYLGDIDKNGILNGDIYIYGSGDPTIGSIYFNKKKNQYDFIAQWAKAIRNFGIKSVNGKLIIDISHFEDWPVVSTWTYEDLGNYYGAGIYGVTLLDNLSELHFSSPAKIGEPTTFKYAFPPIPNMNLENQVVAGKGGDNAYVFQTPSSDHMIVRGDIPAGKNDFVVKACIPNPPKMMADLLSKMLDSIGVKQSQMPAIVNQSNKTIDNRNFVEIESYVSEKLPKIIAQTNFNSVNLFAETLLKEIGSCTKGNGGTKEGLVSLFEFCHARGIKFPGVELVDGSGLSRFDLITTNFMVDFLTYYKMRSPYFTQLFNTLPTSGRDGTMETFDKHGILAGKVHAKTGSMTKVKNLAGYLQTRSGKLIAFTFMANNYDCGGARVKVIQEEILKVLYEL
jgi:serine-type D-Ala-D-Ala carboxypeptidase/endopeptidase (penicillin-binding protein 4)